jgi:gamma-glutamyltranspeptidase/glutathione hydrolase
MARGVLANRLAADLTRRGAVLTGGDLAAYQPVLRRPLLTVYRGHRVWTPPLPSAGGVTISQALQALGQFSVSDVDEGGERLAHLLAEILRRGFADQQRFAGEASAMPKSMAALLAPERLRAWARDLSLAQAAPSAPLFQDAAGTWAAASSVRETPETTHLSVIDAAGNAVAHTTTLNGSFGAGLVARGTGVLWNNGMDDFAMAPGVPNLYGILGSPGNAIAPGRRPLSSMTPTIVERDGHLAFVLGSPGGATIPSSVIQVLVGLIDLGLTPAAAVAAPRIHHQGLPDRLQYERGALAPESRQRLVERGHQLHLADEPQGDVHLLVLAPDGTRLAAPDSRRRGGAAGH